VVAISNRTISQAARAYAEAGVDTYNTVDTVSQLEESIAKGQYAITDNAQLLCQADGIECIIEATGDVEFSADVAINAIRHQKHIVLMNAELDATLGPILKVHADKAGVVVTNGDGDQPGVIMNLYRFVKSIGCRPVMVGNIKGMLDKYRTPETQAKFAAENNLTPNMATSFADGTKLCMENNVVANATGFKVGQRGMYGPECAHAKDAIDLFPMDQMMNGGLTDYILGAEPGPGVFVLGYNDHPTRRGYMKTLKMGDGPLYAFYVPYHLPHLEVPLSAARAVLFGDAVTAPVGAPVCDVITVAKRDLKAGEKLDGIVGFTCYGTIENYDVSSAEELLPMGLSEGFVLNKDIPKDQAIGYKDIGAPQERTCDLLRKEQDERFK
jgi:predicted homoserine dehydrogenase-like protein